MKKFLYAAAFSLGICGYSQYTNIPSFNKSNEIIEVLNKSEIDSIKSNLDRSLVLILTDSNDEDMNSASHFKEEVNHDNSIIFEKQFSSISDLLNILRDFSSIKKIEQCIIMIHGSKNSLGSGKFRGSFDNLSSSEVIKMANSGYKECFTKNAKIIFYSCSTGKGDSNIAKTRNESIGTETEAPTANIGFPVNSVPNSDDKTFTLDTNGRISFKKNSFIYIKELNTHLPISEVVNVPSWLEDKHIPIWLTDKIRAKNQLKELIRVFNQGGMDVKLDTSSNNMFVNYK